MLLNVLSVGYKLGKTTSAQLVVSTYVWWARAEGTWCLCILTCSALRCNCRVLVYQIFLKYPVVQQEFHRFKWSAYIFNLKCCRFREDRYYLSIFPKDRSWMFVDVRTIFGNAICSNFTSINSSISLCSVLSKFLHSQALFIFRIHTTFLKERR